MMHSLTLRSPFRLPALVALLCVLTLTTSCVTTTTTTTPTPTVAKVVPPAKSDVVRVSIVVTPQEREGIPAGSRIVIADIQGECNAEVKDAVMGRLIENEHYDVLSRDYLTQILHESDKQWTGRFNTETAARLGELLGASLFVVGRVNYCGYVASDTPDADSGLEFNIFAILQIIDLETGKVLAASASEGTFIPRATLLASALDVPAPRKAKRQVASEAAPAPQGTPVDDSAGGEREEELGAWQRFTQGLQQGLQTKLTKSSSGGGGDDAQKSEAESKVLEYVRFRAAEDLANSFADDFFRQPQWEEVEMWNNPQRAYSESIRLVKLGQCPTAVAHMEKEASEALPYLSEKEVAEHLHNYGVALLCANRPDEAMEKLRSAYRLGYDESTLAMLGLARKVKEWSLDVQVDEEPEIEMLVERTAYRSGE